MTFSPKVVKRNVRKMFLNKKLKYAKMVKGVKVDKTVFDDKAPEAIL